MIHLTDEVVGDKHPVMHIFVLGEGERATGPLHGRPSSPGLPAFTWWKAATFLCSTGYKPNPSLLGKCRSQDPTAVWVGEGNTRKAFGHEYKTCDPIPAYCVYFANDPGFKRRRDLINWPLKLHTTFSPVCLQRVLVGIQRDNGWNSPCFSITSPREECGFFRH